MRGSAAFRVSVAPGGGLAPSWVRDPLSRNAGASPSLDLRFADSKSLVDSSTGANLVTFTRASSGTYVGSDGLIKTATTNEARFDHNPTTGESLGLLVEEQRTNNVLQSNGFDTTWSNTASVRTAAQAVSPEGVNNGWKLINDASNANHNIFQSASFSAIATTFSVFVKYLNHQWVGVRIGAIGNQFFGSWDLQNGVVGSATAGASIGMQAYGNGWYRLTFTATLTTAGTANLIIGLNNVDAVSLTSYAGSGTGIYIWGAQLEAGSFPTSYIPTTTATVTRSADVASITGANFSSWYNQTEGTVFAETQLYSTSARNAAGFDINDNSTNNRAIFRAFTTGSADQLTVRSGGSTVATISSASAPLATSRKTAIALKADAFAITTLGSAAVEDTSGAVPVAASQILVGSAQSSIEFLSGTIRRLTYWPSRLPNATLQQITR